MLEEILRIDNGSLVRNGHMLLKSLYLQAFKGEILGLISDNIMEKQGILDLLGGAVPFENGMVSFDERRIQEEDITQVFKNKIAVIESKSKLVNNLTIAENIFVVRGGFKKYFVHKRLLYKQAGGLLSNFHMAIPPDMYAGKLTPLERCMVELIKAYATGHRLIVFSDFTSFLSNIELEKVLNIIIWLKKQGVGFIMIENYDDALIQYSDRLVVVQNGKTIRMFDKDDTDMEKITDLLMGNKKWEKVGESLKQFDEKRLGYKLNPKVFELTNVTSEHIKDLSFHLHSGEMINVLYQEEESGEEFFQILKGERKCKWGEIRLSAREYQPTGLWDAIRQGVCFIEEDPISSMLFYDMSVMDNLCFTMSNKVKGLWIFRKYKKSMEKHLELQFGQKILHTPMNKLDPVTLQKLAYSKWLLYLPKIIVCKKPFSAVDVHMREVTEQLLITYAEKGIAVIILTSNSFEAQFMGTRIIQLRGSIS
ncbi:MAG: Monosaccharide-transporting ATPase [Herbinix sp.]|jgi:ABC-type sugar transport system ATPase subunit|nr:Monosaccharide-transporting ATPase [Herbinix sp.]